MSGDQHDEKKQAIGWLGMSLPWRGKQVRGMNSVCSRRNEKGQHGWSNGVKGELAGAEVREEGRAFLSKNHQERLD